MGSRAAGSGAAGSGAAGSGAAVIPPVVDAVWVAAHPDAVRADVRWYPDGRDPLDAYRDAHLPAAVPVELERWLAAPASDRGGRHPLPDPDTFAAGMAACGIGDDDVVVGYDDAGGVIAARLVWMLRVTGHDAAILDGGLQAWPGPVATGDDPPTRRPARPFVARPWPAEAVADIDDVADAGPAVLLDARSAERYAGAGDGLDPRAGHIPGARSLPCRDQLGPDGRLLDVATLRARFAAVGVGSGTPVIASCGSGVTACHTLLVMEHLGIGPGRLYPGSWSAWSRSDRPAATGAEPY
jgi:thiosulfate/3-mercaptopyruvate sulfurtransferase